MQNREIESIYNKHFIKIYRFFYYKVLSREISEDLTSKAFLKFVEIIKIKKDVRDPEKYLYGIVKIVFLEYLKNKYAQPKFASLEKQTDFGSYVDNLLEEIDNSPTPEEIAVKHIDKLPEKQKNVIQMRLIQKMSLKEIAEKLNKDMNYVKTTQRRAIKNLKTIMAALC